MSKRKPVFRDKLASLKKSKVLLISVIAILTAIVATTAAFLVANSEVYVNKFTPSDITTEIVETLDGSEKKDVKVKNTGSTDAFIRAFVTVTWQDENGNIYGDLPVAGTDYNISFDLNNGWSKSSDGFYYWKKSVASGSDTGVLINTCSPVAGKAPSGYKLTVEILGSGMQSVPAHVVTTEWASGVSAVNGDTITIK